MRTQTTLVRDGNSWAVRLPKAILQASGIEAGEELIIRGASGRIMIYSPKLTAAQQDKFTIAKQDARAAWDEAFEQVWLDIFGVEE